MGILFIGKSHLGLIKLLQGQNGQLYPSREKWVSLMEMLYILWRRESKNELWRVQWARCIVFSPCEESGIIPFLVSGAKRKERKRQNKREGGHCRFRLADSRLLPCSLRRVWRGIFIRRFLLRTTQNAFLGHGIEKTTDKCPSIDSNPVSRFRKIKWSLKSTLHEMKFRTQKLVLFEETKDYYQGCRHARKGRRSGR